MHFVSAMFRSQAGMDAVIVLYKGGAPALIDVISGQAHVALPTVVTASAHIRSGKIKPLAVGGAKGLAILPEVPTAAEAGLPGYGAAIWWAWVPTINLRIDYLKPAVGDALKASARVRRSGKTVAVIDIDVFDEKGGLAAVGRGTYSSHRS